MGGTRGRSTAPGLALITALTAAMPALALADPVRAILIGRRGEDATVA
jgi:hypothetical protein